MLHIVPREVIKDPKDVLCWNIGLILGQQFSVDVLCWNIGLILGQQFSVDVLCWNIGLILGQQFSVEKKKGAFLQTVVPEILCAIPHSTPHFPILELADLSITPLGVRNQNNIRRADDRRYACLSLAMWRTHHKLSGVRLE